MSGRKGVRHITYTERTKIEALADNGMNAQEIADYLGRELSGIYKELRRGEYTRLTSELLEVTAYSADIAQQDYDYKATAKGAALKIGNDFALVEYIEQKILEESYSPCAVLAEIREKQLPFATNICFKTLYNYIDNGLFLNLSNKDLLRKSGKKRTKKSMDTRIKHPLCTSIEDRPKEINERNTFGHWEMDTVIGKAKGSGPVLLVLTERLTRYEIIMKMKHKTAAEVIRCLNRLERKYGSRFKRVFKSITVDNGSEFMDTEGIEKSCRSKGSRTKVFYCHPYSSWERGSNENANAIIRRFIPKGTPMERYTEKEILKVEQWINNYPRKILGYKNAKTLFERYLVTA